MTKAVRAAALGAVIAVIAVAALVPVATGAGPDRARIEAKVLASIEAKGKAAFWIRFKEEADLSGAKKIHGWAAKGQFVYDRLNAAADRSQAGVRALLAREGVSYQPFWMINAIKVTAGQKVLDAVAARPEVAEILAPKTYQNARPMPGKTHKKIQTLEWNIDRVRADEVWAQFTRGEGIVVANIDTGVHFNHPAVVRQYRGNNGGGNFDHNYNWFDPSSICAQPQPCDNNDHGTHTMGTMVGEDASQTNQIGVAPGAKWIAAKGCESSSCSDSALLSSGQWVLAPTDLNGQNPRPDLRPHVVNNSWGGGPGDPFYRQTVRSWIASGIFPAFSNGNFGPSCGFSGSPGDFQITYSAGAFNINNNIASFSSRGPSDFGGVIKPNIAAPGQGVRSSIPPNGYASFDGTSMASPHVAATVALMWSETPALIGRLRQTATRLDNSGIDVASAQCGGTTDDNNVWGEGRLDSFEAVSP